MTARAVALLAVVTLGIAYGQSIEPPEDLHALAAAGYIEYVARALSAGAPVDMRDAQGRTPLHVAAREAHLFVVMLLLKRGADVNARDQQKRTPLHFAATGPDRNAAERLLVVKGLLSRGADPKARDAAGKRPVDYADVADLKRALAQ
jgi:ankyrin repeat protein